MILDVHREIGKCFTELGDDPDCRVIVLSGAGKIFSAGESEQLYDSSEAATAYSLTQDHSVI
jgi:enoyl-CoA hydratase/carnithine racemase